MATYRPKVLQQVPDPTDGLVQKSGRAFRLGYTFPQPNAPEGVELAPDGWFTPSHWAFSVLGPSPDTGLSLSSAVAS